jgi:hypothetical protein
MNACLFSLNTGSLNSRLRPGNFVSVLDLDLETDTHY